MTDVASTTVLRPVESGGGTSTTASPESVRYANRVMVACRPSVGWMTSKRSTELPGANPTVSVEPTAEPNGVVHEVVRSPSTALDPRAAGTPMSRPSAVAPPVRASVSMMASGARASRRRVTVASNARSVGSENTRRKTGSGSERHRSVGSTRSRVSTRASGRSSSTSSSGAAGGRIHSVDTGPSSANPTALGPESVPPSRAPMAVISTTTRTPASTGTPWPGAIIDESSRSTRRGVSSPTVIRTWVIRLVASERCCWSRTSCPSVVDTEIVWPTGSARSATRHAVDGSPSTAIAARSSGRYAYGSP